MRFVFMGGHPIALRHLFCVQISRWWCLHRNTSAGTPHASAIPARGAAAAGRRRNTLTAIQSTASPITCLTVSYILQTIPAIHTVVVTRRAVITSAARSIQEAVGKEKAKTADNNRVKGVISSAPANRSNHYSYRFAAAEVPTQYTTLSTDPPSATDTDTVLFPAPAARLLLLLEEEEAAAEITLREVKKLPAGREATRRGGGGGGRGVAVVDEAAHGKEYVISDTTLHAKTSAVANKKELLLLRPLAPPTKEIISAPLSSTPTSTQRGESVRVENDTDKMASPTTEGGRSNNTFELLPERPDFPREEEKILAQWKDINVLQEVLRRTKHLPQFSFYDGPPFATGLPHYGHILAGAVKDVVTRYAQQTGHYVERRFGWDCHGLPVEYEIDKAENITHRQQVLDMGINVYNEKCRSIVLRYASQWKSIVERMGRWVDFDGGYRTMDVGFMESVWWVFKQLFDKGLVYRGHTIMPYSTACSTPLSNFEANLNYKDVKDPSIVVAFRGVDTVEGEQVNFLAWTTTPWTLPSNLALCVNPDFIYLLVRHNETKQNWIVGKERLEWLASQMKLDLEQDITIISQMTGVALAGKRYTPLFPFFAERFRHTGFRVLADTYVTADSGTGVVHCAPAFGEDDFRVCKDNGVVQRDAAAALPCPVDESGCFTAEVGPALAGLYVKAADTVVKQQLKQQQQLLVNADCTHSYPHCWRSETPLIYKAVKCWFIRVECLQKKLLQNCDQTYWVPAFVKEKRFKNWLADARDWCVSRNRFWGTPIPLWVSDDDTQTLCIGSKEELEKYAGRTLSDLHRHLIDDITIPDPRGGEYPPLKRIPEVFDCWFESGSMPYGQLHYPFENKQKFKDTFPADFIGEGLDQTRGWFYTLLVISTALFDQPPFKNLVVNGLVLAADGRKMSKRLRNYADPVEVANEHGADALRIYLISSPVVRADTLRFRVEGVKDIVKDVLLPWYHACRFFVQEAIRYENAGETNTFIPAAAPTQLHAAGNQMDAWILSSTQSLLKFVHQEMQAYRLYTVVPRLLHFLDQLTNWYVRLNRDRMRGAMGDAEALVSLQTLYEVLYTTVLCMAPLAPFTSEMIYQTLKKALPPDHPQHQQSVHFLFLPQPAAAAIDPTIERRVTRMQAVINLGRTVRERQRIPLKTPLRFVRVVHAEDEYAADIQALDAYIKDELNVMEVESSTDTSCVTLSAVPNFRALGARVGKDMKALHAAVQQLTHAELCDFEAKGSISLCGGKHVLQRDDLLLQRDFKHKDEFPHLQVVGDSAVLVLLDCTPDESLQRKAVAREIANKIQKLRKQKNLKQTDDVQMYACSTDAELRSILDSEQAYIAKCLRRELHHTDKLNPSLSSLTTNTHNSIDKKNPQPDGNGNIYFTEILDVGGKPLTVVLQLKQN